MYKRQLSAHDAVSEAAVVAAPHERWGEVPVAFITVSGPDEPDSVKLDDFWEASPDAAQER